MLKRVALLIIAASFLFIVTVPVQVNSHQVIQLHDTIGGF